MANFVEFGCVLQMIFWKLMQILLLVIGTPFRDMKSLETKQTQIKPDANRGFPIELASHIQPQLSRLCWKSCIPTSQNADGEPHTENFIAMAYEAVKIII